MLTFFHICRSGVARGGPNDPGGINPEESTHRCQLHWFYWLSRRAKLEHVIVDYNLLRGRDALNYEAG